MLNQTHKVTVDNLGISFHTGSIGKLSNGAVAINLGETVVFVAVTAAEGLRSADQDFFPLTVDYREKFSAVGRFPGGYFKREGRPSEKEVLTSRLCDRPLRPLFPKGFLNEVQVVGLLMAADKVNESDILFVNAASAAVAISDIPWNGPIGCVRIGEIDGQFVVNPTQEQIFSSSLDLIYVGNEKDMMMIEGSADQIPDERFIEALEFAHQAIQPIIAAQKELVRLAGKPKKTFSLRNPAPDNLALIRNLIGERLAKGVFQSSKQARGEAVSALKGEAEAALKAKMGEANYIKWELGLIFEILQEELFRGEILRAGRRCDGRGPKDLRDIFCKAGVLPRVHGSSLFQRGETQGVVTATLGTGSDVQDLDGMTGGATSKSFILHYNFPPFSVGETGRYGTPGRREIGHGALAERSLLPVLPPEDAFPYTIRLVSDIMESNGSTSMASVCGGTLALMDAGVPITDLVAGISCGLVSVENTDGSVGKYVVLTDIIGSEDHFGDMDFKICGTRNGITGFQLDLKIHGLPIGIAKEAIFQNRETRSKILDAMAKTIAAPRAELAPTAPRIHTIQIDPEKIGLLIGPGGKNIRRICDVSGAQVDIAEDNSGKILIYATSGESMKRAIDEVTMTCGDLEVGATYRGVVRGVKEFGCFVECLPGKEGLVHVSELADFRVHNPEDVAKLGDEMWVKCIGVDDRGKVRLSRRIAMMEIEAKEKGLDLPEWKPGDPIPPRSGEQGGGEGGEGGPPRERRPREGGRDGGRGGDRGRGNRGGGGGGRY